MEENENLISRRQFMRLSACASVGTTSLLSTLMSLRQVNAMVANSSDSQNDYKALVCIFLYGGNDGSNLLVPYDLANYEIYQAGRQQLTLPRESLLRLNPENGDGREFGLHPSMMGCHELFGQGDLAILANVGTLLAPVTLSDFRNRSAALPPNLFSHNDQQVLWQTSVAHESNAYNETGWGGRIADLLHATHNNTSISMSVSLSGTNFFQVGDTLLPYRTSSNGNSVYNLSSGSGMLTDTRYGAFRQLLDKDYANLMEDAFADISNRAIRDADTFNNALATASSFDDMPASGLGQQLRQVARLVEKQAELGQRRQIFFCATGGFDTHGPQLDTHAGLLGGVDQAMRAFHDALASIGMEDKVTTFSASDFGRTFDSNGRGSDHGWGSHHLIMGGAVQGGHIYGSFPPLALGSSPLDTGRGRWIPTTSVDEYGATLALWFGVPESEIATVFPNIGNFINPDIGFMA